MKDYEVGLWKKARRAATLLQLAPFIRFVAVTGSLGRGETKPDSDVDLFIVTERKHLYTARAFALTILKYTGQRINVESRRVAGTVDPNYWLTSDHLDLHPHNAYVARDYTFMVPVWDSADTHHKITLTNSWVADYKRTFRDIVPTKQSPVLRLIQFSAETLCRLWPGLESWTRSVQEKKIRAFAERQASLEKVVLTDRELRLHL
jgi:predicted nucleotidyltransferase